MRNWRTVLLGASLGLCLAIMGCTKDANIDGAWSGNMTGTNAQKHVTTNVDADLHYTGRSITGTVTWHNSTGPWGLMEGEKLTVRSGDVSGNKVAFVADNNLPGGTVSLDLKGKVDGSTMKGTASVNIGSVMGGDTYLGDFELTRK